MNNTECLMTKAIVTAKAVNGKVSLVFKKKNGEVRNMECTLNNDIIMELLGGDQEAFDRHESTSNRVRNNPETIVVAETTPLQWRSCRIDSIMSIDGVEV